MSDLNDYPTVDDGFCKGFLASGETSNESHEKCMACFSKTKGYTLEHPKGSIQQSACDESDENAKKCCFHDHFGEHN